MSGEELVIRVLHLLMRILWGLYMRGVERILFFNK